MKTAIFCFSRSSGELLLMAVQPEEKVQGQIKAFERMFGKSGVDIETGTEEEFKQWSGGLSFDQKKLTDFKTRRRNA
jgi:hypothetical protein